MRVALGLLLTTATILLVGTFAAGAAGRDTSASTTLTVSAQANIFGAGRSSPPAPAGRGPGKSPVLFALRRGATELRFSGGNGRATCCTALVPPPYSGPAGGSQLPGGTKISAFGGLSGVELLDKQMFLVGAFLGPGAPNGSGPPTETMTREPALAQIFYVGAGPVSVDVPAGATRLFLGFADGFGFHGPAGHYDDNAGSVSITVSTRGGSGTTPAGSLAMSLFKHKLHAAAKNAASCTVLSGASTVECTVRNRAAITLCNRDAYPHRPFSLSRFNLFGGPANPVVLRPGTCLKRTLVNPTKKPLVVRIYDELHSQERLTLIVMPARTA